MNKIKLNPPETAPRDGSEFIGFYEFGFVAASYWWRCDQVFLYSFPGMCEMDFTGCCSPIRDKMIGWIEKERFER